MLARKELSFPIDEGNYKRLIVESMGETEKVLKKFLSNIREQFSDEIEKAE